MTIPDWNPDPLLTGTFAEQRAQDRDVTPVDTADEAIDGAVDSDDDR